MKQTLTPVVIACVLSAAISPTAIAFNKAGTVPFTFGGGYYYFASKRHVDNLGVPFGSIGYNFSDRWGIEGLLGIFNTTSRLASDSGRRVDGTLFAVDAVYHFSPYRMVQPYVLAGPGVLGLNPNGNSAHNEGNFNGAVGAQFFIGEKIAFRAEARAIYTFVGGKMDYFLNGGLTYFFNT